MTSQRRVSPIWPFFISVESRKGGVGKSTAALCLAKLLLNRNWNVLVIDADVSGTDLSSVYESRFWSDIYIVKDCNNALKTANMLRLFETEYLKKGCRIHFVSKDDPETSHDSSLMIDLKKVNVIGSHETDPISRRFGSRYGHMDDHLFSTWLSEFIIHLGYEFWSSRSALDTSTAVIVDNGAGYHGLVAEVETRLLDLGPAQAKVLFVTSTDIQDVQACSAAIASYKLQMDMRTGAIAKLSLGNSSSVTYSSDEASFLASVAEVSARSGGDAVASQRWKTQGLTYYRDLLEKKTSVGDEIGSHSAAIVNRTPAWLTARAIESNIKSALQFHDKREYESFLDAVSYGSRVCSVPILQPLQSSLLTDSAAEEGDLRSRARLRHFIAELHQILDSAKNPWLRYAAGNPPERLTAASLRTIVATIKECERSVSLAMQALRARTSSSLTRVIDQELFPESSFHHLREHYSKDLVRIGSISSMTILSSVVPISESMVRSFNPNAKITRKLERNWRSIPYAALLADSALASALLSVPFVYWSKMTEDVTEEVAETVAYQVANLSEKTDPDLSLADISHFLVSLTRGADEFMLQGERSESQKGRLLKRSFSLSQSRLLVLLDDCHVLLEAIATIPAFAEWTPSLVDAAASVVSHCIERRTISHEEAISSLKKKELSYTSIRDMMDVLFKVIRKWKLR